MPSRREEKNADQEAAVKVDLWSTPSNRSCFCLAGRTPATSLEPFKGRAASLMIPPSCSLLLVGGEAFRFAPQLQRFRLQRSSAVTC